MVSNNAKSAPYVKAIKHFPIYSDMFSSFLRLQDEFLRPRKVYQRSKKAVFQSIIVAIYTDVFTRKLTFLKISSENKYIYTCW